MPPLLNVAAVIPSMPAVRCFAVGDLLFAQFACPPQDAALGLWSQTDHLIHVLTDRATWEVAGQTWSAGPGETLFFKKGVYLAPAHAEQGLCLLVFFLPDALVRETIRELSANLPPVSGPVDARQQVIRVNHDVGLTAFLHAMTDYFSAGEPPAEPLLRLKLKELITGILLGSGNRSLSNYFRALSTADAPAIAPIMEANFCHNLPIEAFARMCHRSLSSFKREFARDFGLSPGRWLMERRLACAANLLATTSTPVTEILLECGFEDSSHFSRAFRQKYGVSPTGYRAARGEREGATAVRPL